MAEIIELNLWTEVLKAQQKSINEHLWEPQVLEYYEHIVCSFLDKTWLTEVITRQRLKEIEANSPLFISAQTGCGKTTLIFKHAISIALAEKKKILYLCSRNSLASQIKRKAMALDNNKNRKVGKTTVCELENSFKPSYFNKHTDFGVLDIWTYQAFFKNHKELEASDYAFVVIDEAHFFLSDATFNRYTELTLNQICKKFQNNRRIYLTATPEECFEAIYKSELHYKNQALCKKLHLYHMSEDYSYIRPCFFTELKDLIEVIRESEPEQKWLIFVYDKSIGHCLLDEISRFEDSTAFFTAKTEDDNVDLLSLINDEILSRRIVVSTKVIDVGVNLKNKNLNIVLFEYDKSEIKQMVGRKRVKEGELLNVFFHIPSLEFINRRLKLCLAAKNQYSILYEKMLHHDSFEELAHPLVFTGGKMRINSFHYQKLRFEYKNFRMLRCLYDLSYDNNDFATYYVDFICGCFPGIQIQKNDYLIKTHKERINELLEKLVGKTLNEQKSQSLIARIFEVLGDPRKNKSRQPSLNTANKLLSKYGFCFKKSSIGILVCSGLKED